MPCTSTTCPERAARPRRRAKRPAGGFTLVSALFVLVVLAALGSALAKLSMRQQLGSAAEIEAARAYQSARAGLEWGAFQVLRNPAPPAAAPACFGATSFNPPGSLAGFTVTVNCSRTPASGTLSDGATSLAFYQVVANACNAPSSGACPGSGTPQPTYVERQLTWTGSR
jgi:MSHA biogenesis protein MshP